MAFGVTALACGSGRDHRVFDQLSELWLIQLRLLASDGQSAASTTSVQPFFPALLAHPGVSLTFSTCGLEAPAKGARLF